VGEKVKRELFQIIKIIYKTSELPENYVKSLIIPIPKKTAEKNMKNIEPLVCYLMLLKY